MRLGDFVWVAGELGEYERTLASLQETIGLLDRLRAEPASPKRDAAISRLLAAVISALSVIRDLGGESTTLS